MANMGNQKQKLLYIMEIFLRETDEEHPITAGQIIERLEAKEIPAERKSIYRDIRALQDYGMEIEKAPEQNGFYLAERTFELAELKLLVDAVAASKFITEKKSRELVHKIEQLGSTYQGKHLHRQVVVSDRVKMANERIYYTIDEIYNCIDDNQQMTFQYLEWNEKKEQVLRHQGKKYQVSPAFLLWDNEYYYLVAWDEEAGDVRHYRVDKIMGAQEFSVARSREALSIEKQKANYAKKRFSMFAGTAEIVTLRAPKHMAGVMFDRFGTEVFMRSEDDAILVRTEVEVSLQFFGWITGLGAGVEIVRPASVRQAYEKHLKQIMAQYEC